MYIRQVEERKIEEKKIYRNTKDIAFLKQINISSYLL